MAASSSAVVDRGLASQRTRTCPGPNRPNASTVNRGIVWFIRSPDT